MTAEHEIDDDHHLTVQTLVDDEYMIVVHADDNPDCTVLATGIIEGMVQDLAILVDIAEMNASGFEGRAFIEPEDEVDINALEIPVGIYPIGFVAPVHLSEPTPRGLSRDRMPSILASFVYCCYYW